LNDNTDNTDITDVDAGDDPRADVTRGIVAAARHLARSDDETVWDAQAPVLADAVVERLIRRWGTGNVIAAAFAIEGLARTGDRELATSAIETLITATAKVERGMRQDTR
jgi:hypothetical protein